jgi:RNA polymerase sigma factor (sigma-70 family)
MVAMIRRAAEGDRSAMRQLVTSLSPVIRTAVVSVLAKSSGPGRRAPRQEVEDVTQSVLLSLFADRGAVLQQWDPARGLSLDGFVSLLAKRETYSILRSRRRSPWTEQPTVLEDLDQNAVPRMGPESETISRDMLSNLAEAVRSKLTPKGFELFELMFMRGLPPEEVAAVANMTVDAVYAAKSRLTRQVKEILAELAKTPPTVRPPPLYDYDSGPGLRDPTLESFVRGKVPPAAPSRPAEAPPAPPISDDAAERTGEHTKVAGRVPGRVPGRRRDAG